MDTQNTSLFQLNLDAQNSYTLRNMASWAKVLGFVSLIFAVLCIVGGILFQQYASDGSLDAEYRSSGISSGTFGQVGLVMYVLMGVLYGLSGMFALNAGNKIGTGLRTNNMEVLNAGFGGARNFFALWAILMILMLILVLIGVLGLASAS
jgi:hypothetical protein